MTTVWQDSVAYAVVQLVKNMLCPVHCSVSQPRSTCCARRCSRTTHRRRDVSLPRTAGLRPAPALSDARTWRQMLQQSPRNTCAPARKPPSLNVSAVRTIFGCPAASYMGWYCLSCRKGGLGLHRTPVAAC